MKLCDFLIRLAISYNHMANVFVGLILINCEKQTSNCVFGFLRSFLSLIAAKNFVQTSPAISRSKTRRPSGGGANKQRHETMAR